MFLSTIFPVLVFVFNYHELFCDYWKTPPIIISAPVIRLPVIKPGIDVILSYTVIALTSAVPTF